MLIDIETICRNIDVGSMFFISCNYSFRGEIPSEKMQSFKNSVGDYFDDTIGKNYYSTKRMPIIIKKLIDTQIYNVVEMRNRLNQSNLDYLQLLFLTYKDGAPMMTIGGVLVDDELKCKIENRKIYEKYLFTSCD